MKNKHPFDSALDDLFNEASRMVKDVADQLRARNDKVSPTENKVQPPPVKKGEVVTDSLIKYLETLNDYSSKKAIELVKARDAFGRAKYGQPLMTDDGRDHVEDALQELGDLLQYIWACRMQGRDTKGIEVLIPVLHNLLQATSPNASKTHFK